MPFGEECGVHEWGPRQEVVLQIVGNLSPPRQLKSFNRSILDVHVSIDPVVNQSLDKGILRSFVEVIRPKLRGILTCFRGFQEPCFMCTYVDKLLPDMRSVVGVRVISIHVFYSSKDPLRIQSVIVLHYMISDHRIEKVPSNVISRCQGLVFICKCNVVNF